MYVDKTITCLIKQYDKELYVKWNYEKSYFEVWRTMPWGNRLILPVTERMFGGEDAVFTPLDNRTLEWLYLSDSERKGFNKNYKWLIQRNKEKQLQIKRQRALERTKDYFRDNINILNKDRFTAFASVGDEGDFLAPDVKAGNYKRMHYRSKDNIKEYFGDDE